MKDAPGAMMVNGKILLAVCPPGVNSNPNTANGIGPTSFYEYDYTANGGAGGYANAGSPSSAFTNAAGGLTMLDLPDGTVLLSGYTNRLYVYQPDGSPLAAGQPAIDSVQWNIDGTLHLTGTLFNGITQGASYGDDAQMDSNYPLAQFTDGSGNVTYGTTYNWSSTSVQTGSKVVTTECVVPAGILNNSGTYSLRVVANGNASAPVTFYSPVWVQFNYHNPFNLYGGTFGDPYPTLAEGTNAVVNGGTIFLNGSNQPSVSSETMTIKKPMTITAVFGPATIGQ
jgi:hypothetical protein